MNLSLIPFFDIFQGNLSGVVSNKTLKGESISTDALVGPAAGANRHFLVEDLLQHLLEVELHGRDVPSLQNLALESAVVTADVRTEEQQTREALVTSTVVVEMRRDFHCSRFFIIFYLFFYIF
jgi:hypothetical protein